MNTHSGPANLNLPPNSGKITILEDISIGSLFKTVKASRGTKIIVLKTAVEDTAMSRELLRREYEISRTISHPNIVDTLSFEEDTPIGPAIVMEYIEGVTLSEYLTSIKSSRQRFSILSDILSAVEYLHKKGILHNDIKPDNIVVSRNGTARLIDFGLSVSDDSLYKGVCGGSNGFSAPEILRGEGPAGESSDIYSIGNVIALLFPDNSFNAIVRKCLQFSPEKRYQSITALRKAINIKHHLALIIVAALIATIGTGVAVLSLFSSLHQQEEIQLAQDSISVHSSKIKEMQESVSVVQDGIKEVKEQFNKEAEAKKQADKIFQDEISESERRLQESYSKALTDMKRQKYYEFAGIVKGAYLMDYLMYLQEIPQDEKLALQTVFAQQCHVLDSILMSLPSITTLPQEEQGKLIEMVNAGRIL